MLGMLDFRRTAASGFAPMVRKVAATGTTVLIVEQNVFTTLKVANRGYVLENGHVVLADTSEALLKNDHVRRAYLGI